MGGGGSWREVAVVMRGLWRIDYNFEVNGNYKTLVCQWKEKSNFNEPRKNHDDQGQRRLEGTGNVEQKKIILNFAQSNT